LVIRQARIRGGIGGTAVPDEKACACGRHPCLPDAYSAITFNGTALPSPRYSATQSFAVLRRSIIKLHLECPDRAGEPARMYSPLPCLDDLAEPFRGCQKGLEPRASNSRKPHHAGPQGMGGQGPFWYGDEPCASARHSLYDTTARQTRNNGQLIQRKRELSGRTD